MAKRGEISSGSGTETENEDEGRKGRKIKNEGVHAGVGKGDLVLSRDNSIPACHPSSSLDPAFPETPG